jgi:hypothetical protein
VAASTTSACKPPHRRAFATIGQWLIDHGASDGTINDFGPVHSIFFRDPDGLEAEVLIGKD